ncbi:MAG: ABC transporter ATP-binding protein [Archaeoglobaceae archaeon]|nr:ABC transporter ATP-binding protein [Archaeoglobaceae archaeon]MDW8118202.1 ABC transporter ATP-binding protein [Archaeoglobaceae archaeon]
MDKIVLENLTVRFGNFVAVKNVNIRVKAGEILGLLGPNGAGKTTTIKAILGFVPYEGRIEVKAEKLGWMPQNAPLYLNLTVEENLRFFAEAYGVKKIKEKVEELLKLTELQRFRNRLVRNLSGGMKQRCAFACAIVHEPDLLILDEPTAGVDPKLRKSFWEYFESLNREGKTILITTHYMDEAEKCQRIVLMRDGEILAEGSPEEIKRRALGGEIVKIKVKDINLALEILKKAELNAEIKGDEIWVFVDDAEAKVPDIIKTLESFNVFRVELESETLENAFLKLIGG